MKKHHLIAAFAVLICLSLAMPALGAPAPTKLVKKALGLAKKADKRSKKALKKSKKPGPQGAQGATGPMGPQGPAGADGARGPKGEKGEKGDKGANGHDGAPGQNGTRGRSCIEELGLDACRGPKGGQGPPGLQGARGPSGNANAAVYLAQGSGGNSVYAACPDGKVAIGGGVSSSNSNRNVGKSAPGESNGSTADHGEKPTGWVGKVASSNSSETTTVYAICAE